MDCGELPQVGGAQGGARYTLEPARKKGRGPAAEETVSQLSHAGQPHFGPGCVRAQSREALGHSGIEATVLSSGEPVRHSWEQSNVIAVQS